MFLFYFPLGQGGLFWPRYELRNINVRHVIDVRHAIDVKNVKNGVRNGVRIEVSQNRFNADLKGFTFIS